MLPKTHRGCRKSRESHRAKQVHSGYSDVYDLCMNIQRVSPGMWLYWIYLTLLALLDEIGGTSRKKGCFNLKKFSLLYDKLKKKFL